MPCNEATARTSDNLPYGSTVSSSHVACAKSNIGEASLDVRLLDGRKKVLEVVHMAKSCLESFTGFTVIFMAVPKLDKKGKAVAIKSRFSYHNNLS